MNRRRRGLRRGKMPRPPHSCRGYPAHARYRSTTPISIEHRRRNERPHGDHRARTQRQLPGCDGPVVRAAPRSTAPTSANFYPSHRCPRPPDSPFAAAFRSTLLSGLIRISRSSARTRLRSLIFPTTLLRIDFRRWLASAAPRAFAHIAPSIGGISSRSRSCTQLPGAMPLAHVSNRG